MSNSQFQRFAQNLTANAKNQAEHIRSLDSKALPCKIKKISDNGAIVTVSFEVEGITLPDTVMPVAMHELVRFPIAVDDLGIARPCNRYLGGISGLGGGTAYNKDVGRLTALEFYPVSNTEWVKVNTAYLTVLTRISDNDFNTTPTRLHDKSKIYIDKINEIIDVVNAAHGAGIQKLDNVDDNLTWDQPNE